MYNKYIVLKKTGAALPLWLQTGRAESSLKGGKAEPTLPLTPRPLFFLMGCPYSQIHLPYLALRQHFLKFLFFLPPKQDVKRKFLLTAKHQTHEQQNKFSRYAKEDI
jgi:hypothetical protein